MNKILIQANNLDTVVDVFRLIYEHPEYTKQDIADFCGFSLRQVDYYANACKYLDLIGENWEKTPLADDIYINHPAQIRERIYTRIISDEVMGQIFARLFVLPQEDHSKFAKDLTKQYLPGYSEAVYERRSDNIIKWCQKIIMYINKIK